MFPRIHLRRKGEIECCICQKSARPYRVAGTMAIDPSRYCAKQNGKGTTRSTQYYNGHNPSWHEGTRLIARVHESLIGRLQKSQQLNI